MMHYPATMKKAQAELDAVLGADGYTPPGFQHLEQLTYCVALVKEVFRRVLFPRRGGEPLMNNMHVDGCPLPLSQHRIRT